MKKKFYGIDTRTPELAMGPLHLLAANSQTYIECMDPSIPIERPTRNLPNSNPSRLAWVARTNHPMTPGLEKGWINRYNYRSIP